MDISTLQFVPAPDYFKALLAAIPQAKKRVVIHAMGIMWGPGTEQLLPALRAAAGRGVEVRLVGDMYSKFYAKTQHLSPRTKVSSWSHIEEVNRELKQAGVHVTYVGTLGINPFKGRCHSKVTLIDDLVYTFGGVNFTDDGFTNHDYMLHIRDGALADRLYNLVRNIEADQGTPLPDLREPLDAHTTLLFDGGTVKKSAIYETACDIVAAAKKVYFVSQMCPSGELARRINKIENECYFIRPSQGRIPDNLGLIWDQFRFGIKNRYTGQGYIHAKFILAENRDGSRHIVSGSNNFSWRGVRYGTKEIGVHSTDPGLWQAFYNFLQENIAR